MEKKNPSWKNNTVVRVTVIIIIIHALRVADVHAMHAYTYYTYYNTTGNVTWAPGLRRQWLPLAYVCREAPVRFPTASLPPPLPPPSTCIATADGWSSAPIRACVAAASAAVFHLIPPVYSLSPFLVVVVVVVLVTVPRAIMYSVITRRAHVTRTHARARTTFLIWNNSNINNNEQPPAPGGGEREDAPPPITFMYVRVMYTRERNIGSRKKQKK